jgi:predicted methyltransferase
MNPTSATLIVLAVIATVIVIFVGWRLASRVWSLPCPSLVGWALESPFYAWMTGTEKTIQRIGLRPGQRVLEIGPGPGRLLIPAAQRVLPDGEVVGIDIQPGMVERLNKRATMANVSNLTAILGDATQPIVTEASFDVAFLVTTQCFRALKPGGVLSVTEMLPDPHYQSKATVKRLAEAAGFQLNSVEGGAWLFTANFIKP